MVARTITEDQKIPQIEVDAKIRLNQIKLREEYRPIAPCCRIEDAGKVFHEAVLRARRVAVGMSKEQRAAFDARFKALEDDFLAAGAASVEVLELVLAEVELPSADTTVTIDFVSGNIVNNNVQAWRNPEFSGVVSEVSFSF